MWLSNAQSLRVVRAISSDRCLGGSREQTRHTHHQLRAAALPQALGEVAQAELPVRRVHRAGDGQDGDERREEGVLRTELVNQAREMAIAAHADQK